MTILRIEKSRLRYCYTDKNRGIPHTIKHTYILPRIEDPKTL